MTYAKWKGKIGAGYPNITFLFLSRNNDCLYIPQVVQVIQNTIWFKKVKKVSKASGICNSILRLVLFW